MNGIILQVLDGRDAVRHLGARSIRQEHALGLRSVYEVTTMIGYKSAHNRTLNIFISGVLYCRRTFLYNFASRVVRESYSKAQGEGEREGAT